MVSKVKHSKKAKTLKNKKTQKKRRSMCTRLTNKQCKQPRYTKRCKVTTSKNKGKNAKRAHCRTKRNRKAKSKKTMKGGFIGIIKDALVPLLFTASVIKRGKKKSRSKK
jgi:hypothetical protein